MLALLACSKFLCNEVITVAAVLQHYDCFLGSVVVLGLSTRAIRSEKLAEQKHFAVEW